MDQNSCNFQKLEGDQRNIAGEKSSSIYHVLRRQSSLVTFVFGFVRNCGSVLMSTFWKNKTNTKWCNVTFKMSVSQLSCKVGLNKILNYIPKWQSKCGLRIDHHNNTLVQSGQTCQCLMIYPPVKTWLPLRNVFSTVNGMWWAPPWCHVWRKVVHFYTSVNCTTLYNKGNRIDLSLNFRKLGKFELRIMWIWSAALIFPYVHVCFVYSFLFYAYVYIEFLPLKTYW